MRVYDIEDATQDVELKLLHTGTEHIKDLGPYKRRAIDHLIYNEHRRTSRRRFRCLTDDEGPTDERWQDPSVIAEWRETIRSIHELIAKLPTAQRKAMTAVCLEDRSISEAAQFLQMSPPAVKAALYHGRRALRRVSYR